MQAFPPSRITTVGVTLLLYVIFFFVHVTVVGTLKGWLGWEHLVYQILSFPNGLATWLVSRGRVPSDLARLARVVNHLLFPAIYAVFCVRVWRKRYLASQEPTNQQSG